MKKADNELAHYDQTCQRLRLAVAGRLPPTVDPEQVVTAYAYWVCWRVKRRGTDWEEALREYADIACHRAADESEAERREIGLLRQELAQTRGLVLDVGAGWGRLASLYAKLGLSAVYVEPETLGIQLMRRGGLHPVARSVGEALPFASATFAAAVIGWVLHHDAPDLDAAGIVRETARVIAPAGRLLSIEPLGGSFDVEKWAQLLHGAGFAAIHADATTHPAAYAHTDVQPAVAYSAFGGLPLAALAQAQAHVDDLLRYLDDGAPKSVLRPSWFT